MQNSTKLNQSMYFLFYNIIEINSTSSIIFPSAIIVCWISYQIAHRKCLYETFDPLLLFLHCVVTVKVTSR